MLPYVCSPTPAPKACAGVARISLTKFLCANAPRTNATTDLTVSQLVMSRRNQALLLRRLILRFLQLSSHLHFPLLRGRLSALSPVASSSPTAAARMLETSPTPAARAHVTAMARIASTLSFVSARRASASTEGGARTSPLLTLRPCRPCSPPGSRPRPAPAVVAKSSSRAAARCVDCNIVQHSFLFCHILMRSYIGTHDSHHLNSCFLP